MATKKRDYNILLAHRGEVDMHEKQVKDKKKYNRKKEKRTLRKALTEY